MRKGLKEGLIALVLLALVVSLFLVVGCGEKKTTIKTPEGEVTFDTDDEGNVTVKSDEGTYSTNASEKAPTEADLQLPIYPGSKYVDGSGGVSTISTPEGRVTTATGEWTTTDSLSQVVAFYTGKLGEPTISMDGETTWIPEGTSGTGDVLSSVNVKEQGGKVLISLSRMTSTVK
jgi:hypothetical protein